MEAALENIMGHQTIRVIGRQSKAPAAYQRRRRFSTRLYRAEHDRRVGCGPEAAPRTDEVVNEVQELVGVAPTTTSRLILRRRQIATSLDGGMFAAMVE